MSRLNISEKPEKANTQGVEIHLVKINNNGRKADHSSLVRIQTGGSSASPTYPEKGCADNLIIINVDHPSDVSTLDRNMHERMTPYKP